MEHSGKSRAFNPDYCFARVEQIRPEWLARLGVRGLLIDVDNTLTRWEMLKVPDEPMAWIAELRSAGIACRLLSNGLAHKRSAVSKQTGIELVGGYLFKPVPAFFRRGLRELGLQPAQVLMIGDSVFTDVVAANRCGIWTALIDPVGSRDFPGSKVWRLLENALGVRKPWLPQGDMRMSATEPTLPA